MKTSFQTQFVRTILISVILVTSLIVAAAAVLFLKTFLDKEKNTAQKQMDLIATAMEQELVSFCQLGAMASKDVVLTEYMDAETEENGVLLNDVSLALVNYKKLNVNIRYMTLVRYEGESVRSVGSKWTDNQESIYKSLIGGRNQASQISSSDIVSQPELLTETSQSVLEVLKSSTGFLGVSQDIYDTSDPVLYLYYPFYSKSQVYKELGFLCLGVPMENISALYDNSTFAQVYLTDNENQKIYSAEEDSQLKQETEIIGHKGKEEYLFERYLSGYQWFLNGELSPADMLENVGIMLIFSLVLMALMSMGLWLYCFQAVKRMLLPLEDLKQRMSAVSRGDMSIRMDVEYDTQEINEMASSFNIMVKNVDDLMEQVRQEQAEKQRIELSALQEQIKPHFLYNTLECIHMQAVIDKNKAIERLVMALASYYRLTLGKGQNYVPLSQELKHIENYVYIQNARYGNIITLQVEIPDELMQLTVPKITLQPLVENSIYHGIKGHKGQAGIIKITARREGRLVVVSVADDGTGLSEEEVMSLNAQLREYRKEKGYGVQNVNRRLQISFGGDSGLFYRRNPDKGITVEVRVPFRIDMGEEL